MKTVLFDLDGTISNSEEGITKCAQYALLAFGIEEPDVTALRFFIGPPLIGTFMEHYGMNEADGRAAVAKYRERYNPTGIFECSIYPGVKKVLQSLHAHGYRIGIASSKPEESCKRVLDHLGVTEYFDEIIGATMDGRIDTKEEVLHEAIQRMQLQNKKEVVLIGDTRFDVLGAKAVGIDCIGVTYGFGTREELLESGAVHVYDSMEEVEAYLETGWLV